MTTRRIRTIPMKTKDGRAHLAHKPSMRRSRDRPGGEGIEEVVGDKGYHSKQPLVDLEAVGVRSYSSEPDWGRRNWKKLQFLELTQTAYSLYVRRMRTNRRDC